MSQERRTTPLLRSEFWDWLTTCPTLDYYVTDDNGDGVHMFFPVDEDPEEGVDDDE